LRKIVQAYAINACLLDRKLYDTISTLDPPRFAA
jgi:hypothetical protein